MLFGSRRRFLGSASLLTLGTLTAKAERALSPHATVGNAIDADRMRVLAAWTMLSMDTPYPNPYAAEIFDTRTGASFIRAGNAVGRDKDPSAHAEIEAIRHACKKLGSTSLKGYTLYTTCEPCPMCMGCCLWSRLDRVVYGATIADATRFGPQIMLSAREQQQRWSAPCIVDGPVEEDRCLELFTNPTMQEAFKRWAHHGD